MTFASLKFPFFAALAILAAWGICFFTLLRGPLPRSSPQSGAWAMLVLDEAAGDRETGERLAALGFGGRISESSQYALLDRFGALERIPLDRYAQEGPIEGDPRNDGYAERLRAFFVRDGKRRFFFPLRGNGSAAFFARRLSAALDLPYTLHWPAAAPGFRFFFPAILAALASALLILFFWRRSARPGLSGPLPPRGRERRPALLALVPALCALGTGGPGGLALAGVLIVLAEAVLPLWGEFLAQGGGIPFLLGFDGYGGGRFRAQRLQAAILFPLACVLAFFAGPGIPAFAAALLVFGAAIFLLPWFAALRNGPVRGRRFVPLPILGKFRILPAPAPARRRAGAGISLLVLPWSLAALLAFALCLLLPSGSSRGFPGAGELPGRDEWEAHARFQASFSYRPLFSGVSGAAPDRLSVRLDTAGLVVPREDAADDPVPSGEDIPPPVPLFELAAFLAGNGAEPPAAGRPFWTERFDPAWMAAIPAVLILGILALTGNASLSESGDVPSRSGRGRTENAA